MSIKPPAERKGLLASLTTLAATVVAVLHDRLDLLAVDIEEERLHVLSLLVLTLATLFLFGIGIVLAVLLIVVASGEAHRLLVLGLLAAFFLAAGFAAWRYAAYRTRTKPRLFAGSLAEIGKDRRALGAHS